jgi:beta-phosphoglucomutase
MSRRIAGIAFDLEGTVIDIEGLHHSAHLRAAADMDIRLSIESAIEKLPHFIGGPDEQVAKEIAILSSVPVEPDRILGAKRRYFNQLLEQQTSLRPRVGFKEFLVWIRTLDMKVAIGTVTDRILALRLLDLSSILDDFDIELLVAKEDVFTPKPSPDVYKETARRMDIQANQQLVFEDSVVGVTAARAADSIVVALPTIPTSKHAQDLINAGAVKVFKGWQDENAQRFIEDMVRA